MRWIGNTFGHVRPADAMAGQMAPGHLHTCWRRPLFVATLALLLQGCATTKPPLPGPALAKIHTVAVISLLGDDLHTYMLEMAAIIENDKPYSIPQWGMDDYAADALRRALSPRLQPVTVSYDHQKLYQLLYESNPHYGLNGLIPALRALVANSPVDALLVISPATSRDPINAMPIWLADYGLYRFIAPAGESTFEADMYVNVKVTVLDGQTLQVLSSASDFKFQRSFDDRLRDHLDHMSPRQQESLAQVLKALLARSLQSLARKENL